MMIDFSVMENCKNLMDSYGEICVGCNCCGRFNKETKYDCRLKMYEECLQHEYGFNSWFEGELRKIQEQNVKKNIEYYKNKIAETKLKINEQKGGAE